MTGTEETMFLCGLGAMIGGVVASAFPRRRAVQRRVYWGAWLVSTAILMLATAHEPSRALLVGGFCAVISIMLAYFKTPYLKLGGRIFALGWTNRQPDPPDNGGDPGRPAPATNYGDLGAPALWWIITALLASGIAVGVARGWDLHSIPVTALFGTSVGLTGLTDPRYGFRRFRGQRLAAAVLTLVTAPIACTPILLYLACYEIGRRRPRPNPDDTHAAPANHTAVPYR